MANSNENTQNSKDDQKRTADEGIQDHSEHTAENKQPESEENAAKNDDAAKQEEMKQADTVEQPKEQRKLSDYLETISKLIGIWTVLGILFGGVVIYVYLLKINQLSILPDVISNPSNLIAAITIFIIISIIIFLLYYLLVHLLLPESFSAIQDYRSSKSTKSKSTKSNHSTKIFTGLYNICLSLIFLWAIFQSLTVLLGYLLPKINDEGIYFISFIIILFIFLLILIYYYRNNLLNFLNLNDKESFISFTRLLIILIMIMYLMILGMGDKTRILNFTHIIEIPENSSWYLLHNNFQQNNGSQEVNGIDKNDLIKLKQNFKCSILSEEEKTEKNIECSSIPEQRNNALYGYMAWNLGDTKVFCPPTIDNTKADSTKIKNENSKIKDEDSKTKEQEAADELAAKEAKKLTKECIVISGKALQIMPEGYISTEPIQQPKYDVKEPTIEINCCNCNPNSPKNKDDHPDIEYTDKKICQ